MRRSVAEAIAERIEAMPAGERRAAQYLVANYPLAGLKTVAEFAALAGTSPPTILRFVSRLGFQNYPEFQARLQDELAERLQSPLSRAEDAPSSAPDDAPPLAAAAIENLRETFQHVSQRQIAAVVESLCAARGSVFIAGGRFTDPLAAYMAAHMTIIRPHVVHLPGQDGNRRDRLLDMGRTDLLVIFDIRRYQEGLFELARSADARNTRIVLFTDQWLSPIGRVARHVMAGRTAVPSAWDSSASLIVLIEAVLAAMTSRLGPGASRRLREMEELRER